MQNNPAWIPGVGEMSGRNVIGEVTESLQAFIKGSWERYTGEERPPTISEDLTYESMDRNEQVVFVYMYRLAANTNLQNQKRWRQAPIYLQGSSEEEGAYLHRPPVLIDLFYLVTAHAKFRSEAERLLGWLMLALNEATHLIYRPRKFLLPNGQSIDSLGRPYDPNVPLDEDNLVVEKISLALTDDLTVGDAVNFFSLHEAPYRPFLTYRARLALDGPLIHSSKGTTVRLGRLQQNDSSQRSQSQQNVRPNGRPVRVGRASQKSRPIIGPEPHSISKLEE
ncbi:MAG: hypothetical protein CMK59_06165 [Proteobacteria bacterium]|nr:hypothetical protein [Pseudomonadota bacterium]